MSIGAGDGIRPHDTLPGRQENVVKLLNKLCVSQFAELGNLSKAYTSQVKHGKRPPSEKLLNALAQQVARGKTGMDYPTLS